ncbi:MAG: pentatricopeptide repeat protein [Bacillariaceae sp.]|jgi:pentatricopeptide repeat protein
MAYGAMLRLCAARGQPERAIGLLEDMERFEVKPTTLCFSAALRSVARSHETAIRFERGWSRRDMLRETTAAHHGKMARQIVILAEVTEVEHDDGFISALMLCTAAAGDSATTKAVLLASEVRKMDHLRTIGGSRQEAFENHDDDLQLESGEMTTAMTTTNIDAELAIGGKSQKSYNNNKDISTYTEREYGKDTRVISALIHSCAQAMNKNGIGTMWAGRENLGSLDENSLRLITTRWEPSYVDTSVPGVSSTKVGIGALRRMDEKEKYEELKPGKRKKFRGLYIDDEDLITIDDIEDGDDSTDWNGENDTLVGEDDLFSDDNEPLQNLLEYQTSDHNDDEQQEDSVPQYTQSEVFEKFLSELKDEATKNGEKFDLSEVEARELFDMMHDEFLESDDDDDDDDDEDENEPSISEEYDQFLAELKKQSEENDEKFDLNDVQVQELFDMMQNEYDDDSNENKRDIASYDEVGGNDLTTNDNENSVLPEDKASKAVLANIDPTQLSKIEDLQSALPGMPLSRLKKIVDAYEETLGHPSMLKLVPILRETMPDTLSSGWLKRNNKKNADFALLKATEDGLVDSALLNSMLQVKANSGSLNEALEHHADHFAKHKLVSTTTMKYGFVCAYKTKRFT